MSTITIETRTGQDDVHLVLTKTGADTATLREIRQSGKTVTKDQTHPLINIRCAGNVVSCQTTVAGFIHPNVKVTIASSYVELDTAEGVTKFPVNATVRKELTEFVSAFPKP